MGWVCEEMNWGLFVGVWLVVGLVVWWGFWGLWLGF